MRNLTRALMVWMLGAVAACGGGAAGDWVGTLGVGGGSARSGSVSAGVGGSTAGPSQVLAGAPSQQATDPAKQNNQPLAGTAGAAPSSSPARSAAAGSGGRIALAAGSGGGAAGTSGLDSPPGAHVRGPSPTEQSASIAGPYKVAQYTDGFRDGPEFGATTIYYPTDAEAPFAMIVFCPGFLGTQASAPPWSDSPWGPFMASHGIVFMLIDTNTPSDGVAQRQAALWDALSSLKAEHTRSDSPLKGKLDSTRVGLMGWSMGGGGSWLNAKEHPELKSVVTLAGHNNTAGGAEPDRGITVPTLMFAGTADTAVLGLGMSQPVYEVIPDSTPKMLYEVQDADHFAFNDPSFNDNATGRYALSWQKVFLEGDARYRQFLLVEGPKASDFRSTVK